MSSRKFRSQEEKNSLIESFIKSNLTQVAWAKENNISVSTLSSWLKKYKKENQSVRFVEVTKGQVTNQIMSHLATAENEVKTNSSQTTVLVEVGLCKIHLPQQMLLPLIATIMKGGDGDV